MSEDIRPSYYKHPSGVECRQITDYLDFNLGNALKYTWRWQDKNGLDDLIKARFYLASFISIKEESVGYPQCTILFFPHFKIADPLRILNDYLSDNGGNRPLREVVRDMISIDPVTDWRERSLRAINEEISSIEARAK